MDWYNYLDDPSQLTEVTSERGEQEEHTDHSYHIRSGYFASLNDIMKCYLQANSDREDL